MPVRSTLSQVIEARLTRRAALGTLGGAATFALLPDMALAARPKTSSGAFGFEEIAHGVSETHVVPSGHKAQILLRWGDPILTDAPAFDPYRQSVEAQLQQFGYNNDYVGFIPLGGGRGLLCVNHEYTVAQMMFPGVGIDAKGRLDRTTMTARHCAIEQAATGGSIVEIRRDGHDWRLVLDSPLNRRISASHSAFDISGPARGAARMQTTADPAGVRAIGTFGNCAGGITPWGSYLSAEENVDEYFGGMLPAGHAEADNHRMMGVPGGHFEWYRHEARFDIGREPNEPNRFGWIVEIDALDPAAPMKKRTALGRFKHEGAETVIGADGRLAIYMGDDEAFQCLYRFVSRDRVDMQKREANRDLLDHGTLSVARFDEDGTLTWLPLVHGQGPLTPSNGFHSQADVVIEARRAAMLLGGTPMDRPEDVQPHPHNGRVYVNLTNNVKREEANAANPRVANISGHIIELQAPDNNHGAAVYRWDALVQCGLPETDGFETGARWNPATSVNGWFSCPDGAAMDPAGRLWIASDQGGKWAVSGTADGLWALGVDGDERGRGKMFFRAPVGAETTGPCFAPDGRSLFLSVQHPGIDGTVNYPPFARVSWFADPATRWPDFRPDMPPRPSVVVIRREDGGVIGG